MRAKALALSDVLTWGVVLVTLAVAAFIILRTDFLRAVPPVVIMDPWG